MRRRRIGAWSHTERRVDETMPPVAIPNVPAPRLAARLAPRAALAAILAAGIVLRLVAYGTGRSLWLDEASLASSIITRSYAGLLRPLDYDQVAPIGFLVVERLAVAAFGPNEYALRLLPLVAGIGALFLFRRIAERCLAPGGVLLALALFSLSSHLIYFSSEAKPYSSDVAVALLLMLAAVEVRRRGTVTVRSGLTLALVGGAAVWFSQPSALVLGGIALGLTAAYARERDWGAVRRLGAVYALWGVSFVPAYLQSLRYLTNREYMDAFWRTGFLTLPPSSLRDLQSLYATFDRVFADPLGLAASDPLGVPVPHVGIVPKVAAFAGAAWVLKRRESAWAVVLAPVAAALAASALRLFPFGSALAATGRVILFLVPSLLLLVAAGAEALRTRVRVAGPGVYLFLLAWPVYPLARSFPYRREEMNDAVAYIRQHRRVDDGVYVYFGARNAFRFYGPQHGFTAGTYVVGECAPDAPLHYLRTLEGLRGRKRVWLVFTQVHAAFGADERDVALAYMNSLGAEVREFRPPGVSVHLYELETARAGRASPPRPAPALPARAPFHDPLYCAGPYAPAPPAAVPAPEAERKAHGRETHPGTPRHQLPPIPKSSWPSL
jgi:hypothetical protein